MQNYSLPTLVWWQTPRTNKSKRIISVVAGFGLRELSRNAYWGSLTRLERNQLERKMRAAFHGSRDKLFFLPLCRGCSRRMVNLNVTDDPLKETELEIFE